MRSVLELTAAELTAENKALMAKKREIAERQADISAETARRATRSKVENRLFGLSEEEIDELSSAVKRRQARRESLKVEGGQS